MTKAEREIHLLTRVATYIYGSRWQRELAREFDLNERTVRSWVQGRYTINPKVWLKIRDKLDRKVERAPIMQARVEKFIAANVEA